MSQVVPFLFQYFFFPFNGSSMIFFWNLGFFDLEPRFFIQFADIRGKTMGFASVFLATSKSWDLMMPWFGGVKRCFQTNGSNPPIWNSLQGIPIAFAWLILKSRRLTLWPVFFSPSSFGRWLGSAPRCDVASLANDSPNQSMVVLGFLRDIFNVAISLHASFPVYDKYMIFYIYTVQKTLWCYGLWWFLWWFICCVGFCTAAGTSGGCRFGWLGIVGCTIGWQKTTAPFHALFWEQTNPLITMFWLHVSSMLKVPLRLLANEKQWTTIYFIYLYTVHIVSICIRWHNMISPMFSIRLRLHLWLQTPAMPLTGPASSRSTQIDLAWGETLMRSCRQRFRDGYILHHYHATIFSLSQYYEFPCRRM